MSLELLLSHLSLNNRNSSTLKTHTWSRNCNDSAGALDVFDSSVFINV